MINQKTKIECSPILNKLNDRFLVGTMVGSSLRSLIEKTLGLPCPILNPKK